MGHETCTEETGNLHIFMISGFRREVMRSALFCYIMQRMVAIPYRRFGTTYRSHFQGSRILDKELPPCAGNMPEEQISQTFQSKNLKLKKHHWYPAVDHWWKSFIKIARIWKMYGVALCTGLNQQTMERSGWFYWEHTTYSLGITKRGGALQHELQEANWLHTALAVQGITIPSFTVY